MNINLVIQIFTSSASSSILSAVFGVFVGRAAGVIGVPSSFVGVTGLFGSKSAIVILNYFLRRSYQAGGVCEP